jgi:6-phosphogluconolactonase (cycloisomerase 2 family)
MSNTIALYSAVGSILTTYHVNCTDGSITRLASVEMPSRVQYAWKHPRLPVWYAATASGGPRQVSQVNHLGAWRMRPDGTLAALGAAQPLPARAVHICVHPSGRFVLSAQNHPASRLTVHQVNEDGSIGDAIEQPPGLDFGVYPHQVMTLPGGGHALVVDRGNQPNEQRGEQPGALRTYAWNDGVLGAGQVVAPNGGYGFGPRHVDFHPTRPWMYVSDERFNRLHMFRLRGDRIDDSPAFSLPTLRRPDDVRPRQLGGPIHVHPAGGVVYVANRADGTLERNGRKVFAGGENNIAVYRIDAETGEPILQQHADTFSFHVRTFVVDATGRLLIAASIKSMDRVAESRVEHVPAALSVFRIDDGLLTFLHRHDLDVQDNELQYWIGTSALPSP